MSLPAPPHDPPSVGLGSGGRVDLWVSDNSKVIVLCSDYYVCYKSKKDRGELSGGDHIFTCPYIYMSIYLYIYVLLCLYNIHPGIYISRIYMHTSTYIYICIVSCICVFIPIYICIYICIHMHTRIHTYTCIHRPTDTWQLFSSAGHLASPRSYLWIFCAISFFVEALGSVCFNI